MNKHIQHLVIIVVLGAMIFSSALAFQAAPGAIQGYHEAKNEIGGATGFTLAAYANFTKPDIAHYQFGITHVSAKHSEYDVSQGIPIQFSATFLQDQNQPYFDCLSSGAPSHFSAGLQLIDIMNGVSHYEPIKWDNVTMGENPVTEFANTTLNPEGPMVIQIYLLISAKNTDNATWYNSTSPEKSITINPIPTLTISGSTGEYMDTNTTTTYTAHPCGGWVPYAYQWYSGNTPIGGATSSSYTQIYTAPGTYDISLCAEDATGYHFISNTIQEVANYPPQVRLASSAQDTQAGTAVQFTSNEIHGTGTISYTWSQNGSAIPGQTGADYDRTFTVPSTYRIGVRATDQAGHSANQTIAEIVNGPASASISLSQPHYDVGQTGHFAFHPEGSTGIFVQENYTLRGVDQVASYPGGAPKVTGTGSSFNYTLPSSYCGDTTGVPYCVSWNATSSDGAKISARYGFLVNLDPTITVKSKYSSRDAGQSDTLCASGPYSASLGDSGVYGGWQPYNVSWDLWQAGNWTSVGHGSALTYTFPTNGTYEFKAHLTDGVGFEVNSTPEYIQVLHAFRLNVSISPNYVPVLNGYPACSQIQISARPIGGTGAIVRELVNGVCCYSPTVSADGVVHFQENMPSAPGDYTYAIQAYDGNGAEATAVAHFVRIPYDMNVSYTAPSVLLQGDIGALTALAHAPAALDFLHTFVLVGYNYIWHVGNKNYSGSLLTHDFRTTGEQHISITANATYQILVSGIAEKVHESRTERFQVDVLNRSATHDVSIRQYENKTATHYKFSYWVSFNHNSSYKEALITIGNTTREPNVVAYPNGTVFIQQMISDNQYPPGKYPISLIIIDAMNQESSASSSFRISLSSSSQFSIYSISAFFGGFFNFLIFISTIGGLVIAYAALKEAKEPPEIDITNRKGRTTAYRLQGTKVKTPNKKRQKT